MVTVLLALLMFVGFALLVSAVCERELLRAEREEKPQRVTHFHEQDERGQGASHVRSFATNFKEDGPAVNIDPSRSRIRAHHTVPSEKDKDEVAA